MEYSNLTAWKIPSDYGGKYWFGWFPVYSQNRDSDALTRSNYRRILEDLRKLDQSLDAAAIDGRNEDSEGDSTVTDTRCNHWAVGWVEVIYVHSSNVAACKAADEILDALSDYPVYDESDFSQLETDELENYWQHCGMRERIDICKRAGVSFLQARHDDLSRLSDRAYDWYRDHYAQ